MSQQSFVRGAFILALAHLISRVLGAVYRIPLYRIMGDEGIGLIQMAYPVYSTVLAVSTVGLPVAVSKLVAEKIAQHKPRGALRVFTTSLVILAFSGLFFSVLLYTGASFIVHEVTGDPRAFLSIVAISPAIFFVAIMSAFRGYFQGLQNMTPTAVSQIIEQVVRVGTMFLLAWLLLPKGLEFAAAGATFGAVTGAIVGLLYLIYVYAGFRPGVPEGSEDPDPFWLMAKRIVLFAIPISLVGIIMPLIQLIDMSVVPGRLQASGLDFQEATRLYGQLSGGAVPLINMPTVFTAAIAASLVPSISEAAAVGSMAQIRRRTSLGLKLTIVIVLPATVGMYLLATPIADFLYGAPEVGAPLAAMSSVILFLGIQMTTSAVLQGMGKTMLPVQNLVAGAVVKLILTWFLTFSYGIQGAAYASVAGFLIAAGLNMAALHAEVGSIVDIGSAVLKPVLSSAAMAATVILLYPWAQRIFESNGMATLLTIGAGAAIYGMLLLGIGTLSSEELHAIPGVGPRLYEVLLRLGLAK